MGLGELPTESLPASSSSPGLTNLEALAARTLLAHPSRLGWVHFRPRKVWRPMFPFPGDWVPFLYHSGWQPLKGKESPLRCCTDPYLEEPEPEADEAEVFRRLRARLGEADKPCFFLGDFDRRQGSFHSSARLEWDGVVVVASFSFFGGSGGRLEEEGPRTLLGWEKVCSGRWSGLRSPPPSSRQCEKQARDLMPRETGTLCYEPLFFRRQFKADYKKETTAMI